MADQRRVIGVKIGLFFAVFFIFFFAVYYGTGFENALYNDCMKDRAHLVRSDTLLNANGTNPDHAYFCDEFSRGQMLFRTMVFGGIYLLFWYGIMKLVLGEGSETKVIIQSIFIATVLSLVASAFIVVVLNATYKSVLYESWRSQYSDCYRDSVRSIGYCVRFSSARSGYASFWPALLTTLFFIFFGITVFLLLMSKVNKYLAVAPTAAIFLCGCVLLPYSYYLADRYRYCHDNGKSDPHCKGEAEDKAVLAGMVGLFLGAIFVVMVVSAVVKREHVTEGSAGVSCETDPLVIKPESQRGK